MTKSSGESRRLADELRRVINRLVLVRAPEQELAEAADAARAFAERLEALPQRGDDPEISEAGLDPMHFVEHSPVSGRSNAVAPPVQLRFVPGADGPHVEGTVTFGAAYEGPPGHVHGGWLSAMFDEMLGMAQREPGFTASLTIRYRKMTPLNRQLDLRAWVDSVDGRKRRAVGTCHVDGTLLCEAEGLFISPRPGTSPWLFDLPAKVRDSGGPA